MSAEKWVDVEVSEETKRKLGKLLKELQAKGENVKTEDDAVTYLLNHQKKQSK